MSPVWILLLSVVLILANGFFVAVEFSLMAARRGRIEEMAEQGSSGARLALAGMRNLNLQLAASQLGISIVSLLLGWLIEPVVSEGLADLFGRTALPRGVSHAIGLALGLVIVAFVHMVIGEMVPKSLALSSPERAAVVLAPIHRVVVVMVRPVVAVLYWLARIGTRLVGVEPTDELAQAHTAVELAVMVEESRAGGELEPSEHELLVSALGFLAVQVDEVMAPREQLVTVPHTATVAQAETLVYQSGHSRVLVLGDGPDEITGFLHAKDLIGVPADQRDGFLPPGIVRVALRVGPTDHLEDVLPRMRRARRHVAVVVEGDRVRGLVTLEDILEAIVGDIRDESDRDDVRRRCVRGDGRGRLNMGLRNRVVRRWVPGRAASAHRVTVVSPHYDDVPLSLGQSLRDGALSACHVRVRVAFGRSNWTSWVHPTPERAPYVSLWRKVEESAAALLFGYHWTAAGWEEVILRTGEGDPALLLDAELDLTDEPLVGELADWLRDVAESPVTGERPELLLVAAGLGGHVDHRILATAAASLVGQVGCAIGFYEDRPYVVYLDAAQRDAQLAPLGLDLEPVDVSGPPRRSTQMWARRCYPSQMVPFFEEAMDLDRVEGSHERVWFPVGTRPDWF